MHALTKQSQILPNDVLVEIAEYDWRVYNAITRANMALNARLHDAKYRQPGNLGNYAKHVYWMPDAAVISHAEIAQYRRFVIDNLATTCVHVYKQGVLARVLIYDNHDDYIEFKELERNMCGEVLKIAESQYKECNLPWENNKIVAPQHNTRKSVLYREYVRWNGEIKIIYRYRKHPRGYIMWDIYNRDCDIMRFDDYYLAKRTSSRYVDANEATWRVTGDFFVYDYARVNE